MSKDGQTFIVMAFYEGETLQDVIKRGPLRLERALNYAMQIARGLARRLGLCAKYAGSGGAIVGICEEDDRFLKLKEEFGQLGCEVIRPTIQKPAADEE